MALVCRKCDRELKEAEMPDDPRVKLICPGCQSSVFIARPDAWNLSENDKRFLRSVRIAPADVLVIRIKKP
jgi:hypothetical protein